MLRALLITTLFATACATTPEPPAQMRFENGLWFTGTAFEPLTVAVREGRLDVSAADTPASQIIDLSGKFVVPPFCEGHNHNLGGSSEGVEETVRSYLQDGVFYAMMPGSFKLYRDIISDDLNTPDSVDVAFANNGLTGSGGHPRSLRESLMDRFGLYPEFTKETLPDKGYFEADTLSEVREKWALIEAEQPDFVKVMLYFSSEYEDRKDDPEYYGKRGLDPDLLPEVVRLAHDSNLRVAVHVETDNDMATALRSGADIIMHLPSYDSAERISEETISLAKETGAALVTTFTVARRYQSRSPEAYAAILDAQRDNLRRLQAAEVNLVLGSDSVRDTSRGEADHLESLGVLGNWTLLNMWTRNCASMVFPDRKVGRIENGFEASFVVLDGDPLTDFSNTRKISLRVKDGQVLNLESANDTAQPSD